MAFASCEECDTIYRRVPLKSGQRAYCICCGAEIYREIKSFNQKLALVLTAIIVFIIANSFPIVRIEVQGHFQETTLLGAAWTMFHIDRPIVAIILLLTTFVVPLLDLLLLSYVFFMVSAFKTRPKYMVFALRTLHLLRTWGMIEVFLIGILVTLVKLANMVIIIPEIALWAFAMLSALMVYLNSIKVKDIWNDIDRKLP
ncbi:paraquat-inducible protein A [Acinetobacter ihumii]|uniref:paraquat-inducible protein A n=1 Tax=Acinetobacter ihumii TaxID=2483802 RepID=UPI001D18A40B|nr:paraquat-inducible protein A [Acinetobacter ihumii]